MSKIRVYLEELRSALTPRGLLGRVDTEQCLSLVDAIEEVLPDTVGQAERIVRERDAILAHARGQAQEELATAEQTARRMTSDSAILARADSEAERCREAAQREAQAMLDEHRAQACELMDSLLRYLSAVTDRAKDYRRELAATRRKR